MLIRFIFDNTILHSFMKLLDVDNASFDNDFESVFGTLFCDVSNSKSTYNITRKVLALHHFSSNYILSTSSIPEGIARLYMILKYTANDLSISIYR